MLQHIKNWLLANALFVALSTSILIGFFSLVNTNYIPKTNISVSDKFLHTIAYIGLMWSWLLVFRKRIFLKLRLKLLLYLILFGIILEVLQGEVALNRTADWRDIIANMTGLLLGLLTFKYMYKILFR